MHHAAWAGALLFVQQAGPQAASNAWGPGTAGTQQRQVHSGCMQPAATLQAACWLQGTTCEQCGFGCAACHLPRQLCRHMRELSSCSQLPASCMTACTGAQHAWGHIQDFLFPTCQKADRLAVVAAPRVWHMPRLHGAQTWVGSVPPHVPALIVYAQECVSEGLRCLPAGDCSREACWHLLSGDHVNNRLHCLSAGRATVWTGCTRGGCWRALRLRSAMRRPCWQASQSRWALQPKKQPRWVTS